MAQNYNFEHKNFCIWHNITQKCGYLQFFLHLIKFSWNWLLLSKSHTFKLLGFTKFSFTLFWQKFRETNGFTEEINKELISRFHSVILSKLKFYTLKIVRITFWILIATLVLKLKLLKPKFQKAFVLHYKNDPSFKSLSKICISQIRRPTL